MKLKCLFRLLVVIFLLSANFSFGQTQIIEIKKSGEDSTDWKRDSENFAEVKESHLYGKHKLICKGKGYTTADWMTSPTKDLDIPRKYVDDMVQYANEQMKLGKWEGTYESDFEYNNKQFKRILKWTGIAPRKNIVTIEITPVDSE